MPTPIRPVNNISGDFFSVVNNKELVDDEQQELIAIPGQYSVPQLEVEDQPMDSSIREAKAKFRKASPEQLDMLYNIWNNGSKMAIEAQVVQGVKDNNIVYQIPRSMSPYDVNRLSVSGLVKSVGSDIVSFTDAGRMALSKKIMDQPSEFVDSKSQNGRSTKG